MHLNHHGNNNSLYRDINLANPRKMRLLIKTTYILNKQENNLSHKINIYGMLNMMIVPSNNIIENKCIRVRHSGITMTTERTKEISHDI